MKLSVEPVGKQHRINIDKESKTRIETLSGLSYDLGGFRSPSEAESLLVQMTKNCSWNACGFCNMHTGQPFEVLPVPVVKRNIDVIKEIDDIILEISDALGFGEKLDDQVYDLVVYFNPILGDPDPKNIPFWLFRNVYKWRESEDHNVFIQDADSPAMYGPDFIECLKYLRQTINEITRTTTYACSQSVYEQGDYLPEIREWLDRLHIGMETGYAPLLRLMNKVNSKYPDDIQITAGLMAKAAKFQVSEYYMPGAGGLEWLENNAIHTAKAMDIVNPHYIRLRPYSSGREGTPHTRAFEDGELTRTSRLDKLKEIGLFVENLKIFSGKLCFDITAGAYIDTHERLLFDMGDEGYQFPDKKDLVLSLVDEGLKVSEEAQVRVIARG